MGRDNSIYPDQKGITMNLMSISRDSNCVRVYVCEGKAHKRLAEVRFNQPFPAECAEDMRKDPEGFVKSCGEPVELTQPTPAASTQPSEFEPQLA